MLEMEKWRIVKFAMCDVSCVVVVVAETTRSPTSIEMQGEPSRLACSPVVGAAIMRTVSCLHKISHHVAHKCSGPRHA